MDYTSIVVNKMKLFKEDGRYYLRGNYIQKDNKGNEVKIKIPKICLGLLIPRTFETREYSREINPAHTLITVDHREYPLDLDKSNKYVYFEQPKDAIKEMTVEEIEKELGYKIKIINKDK